MNVLVFNAGSASLKFELIRTDSHNLNLQQLGIDEKLRHR